MIKTITCPVCEAEVECNFSNGDDGTLYEADVNCRQCGYYYQHGYGYTSHFVDGEEFFYSWDDTDEHIEEVMRDFYEAVRDAVADHTWRKG